MMLLRSGPRKPGHSAGGPFGSTRRSATAGVFASVEVFAAAGELSAGRDANGALGALSAAGAGAVGGAAVVAAGSFDLSGDGSVGTAGDGGGGRTSSFVSANSRSSGVGVQRQCKSDCASPVMPPVRKSVNDAPASRMANATDARRMVAEDPRLTTRPATSARLIAGIEYMYSMLPIIP